MKPAKTIHVAAPPGMPNPVSCPEHSCQGADADRNLYCLQYSACLQFAARKGWRNWTCKECTLNLGAKPPGAGQWAEARIRRD